MLGTWRGWGGGVRKARCVCRWLRVRGGLIEIEKVGFKRKTEKTNTEMAQLKKLDQDRCCVRHWVANHHPAPQSVNRVTYHPLKAQLSHALHLSKSLLVFVTLNLHCRSITIVLKVDSLPLLQWKVTGSSLHRHTVDMVFESARD